MAWTTIENPSRNYGVKSCKSFPLVRRAPCGAYFALRRLLDFTQLLVSSWCRCDGYPSIKAFIAMDGAKRKGTFCAKWILATVQSIPKAPNICYSCQYCSLSTPSRLNSFVPFLLLELLMVRCLGISVNMSITASWCSIYRALSLLEPAGRYFGGIYLRERYVKEQSRNSYPTPYSFACPP
jgi:hypothetical protein